MAASDLRIRAVLAPTMLLIVGLVYWLDFQALGGLRQGSLSAGLLALLGLAGVWEYTALLRGQGFAVAGRTLLAASALLLGSAFLFDWQPLGHALAPLVGSTFALVFWLAARSLQKAHMQVGLEVQGASVLGFVFLAWPFYLAIGTCFRHLPSVLFVVLVCKGGDIGGYCLGRLFGRHKLIPHISPGKTIEGALGSLLTSVLLAVALRGSLLAPELVLPLWAAVLVGVALNVTTQTGDLIESLLKRRCNAKDSSKLLPAHGGVLDLTDSLVFSFGVWFVVLFWLG